MKIMSMQKEELWEGVAPFDVEIRKLGKQISDLRKETKQEIFALEEKRRALIVERRKRFGL
jgi:hypothetical protein